MQVVCVQHQQSHLPCCLTRCLTRCLTCLHLLPPQVLLDLGRLLDFQAVALQHRDAEAQARRRSQVVDSATSDMSMHMSADAFGTEDEYEDDLEEEVEGLEGLAEEQAEQEVQRASAVSVAQQQVAGTPGQGSSAAAGAAIAAGEGHAAAADTCCMTDDSAYLVDGSGAGPHPWLSPSWADHVQATAQRLLQVVCRRGLAHTASWLLELLHAQSCDPAELVKVGCRAWL
jgi:hypothetical protein